PKHRFRSRFRRRNRCRRRLRARARTPRPLRRGWRALYGSPMRRLLRGGGPAPRARDRGGRTGWTAWGARRAEIARAALRTDERELAPSPMLSRAVEDGQKSP